MSTTKLSRSMTLLVVVLGLLALAVTLRLGYAAAHYVSFLRMISSGLVVQTADPHQALMVLLPGATPYRTPPADQWIDVNFANVTNAASVRDCAARLGKCNKTTMGFATPANEPDVAAILDATQPNELWFLSCTVGRVAMTAAAKAGTVTKFTASDSTLVPGALAPLAGDPRLSVVVFVDVTLDSASLDAVLSAPNLAWLKLADCTIDAPAGWKPSSPAALARLGLSGKTTLPDDGGAWIASQTKLTALSLSAMKKVFPPETLAKLPQLTELSLRYSRIDDDWLRGLPKLPNVAQVDLAGAIITDDGLRALCEQAPGLSQVTASECCFSPEQINELKAAYPGVKFVLEPCQ